MVIGRIRFLASTIAPKPEEIEYWIDLSEDKYGCVIKCYNGVEWERIDLRTYDEIISFKYKLDELLTEIQKCEDDLLLHKEDFEEYKNETNSSLNTINDLIESINASLETLLGESASEFIDKYNEILNFLTGYEDTDTLQSILSDLKNEINLNISEIESNVTSHISNKSNPHNVTKQQIGLSNVTNDVQVKRSEMGAASGVATLNELGLVPSNQLPSYVDDVIDCYAVYDKADDGTLSNIKLYSDTEHQNTITGESGKIYVDITGSDSAYQFRWTGTLFTVVGAPTVIGEVTGTAFDGARGKALEDKINLHESDNNNPHNVTKQLIGLNNVDNTSDINKPISNATQSALNNKLDILRSGTNIKTVNGESILGGGNITIDSGLKSYTTNLDFESIISKNGVKLTNGDITELNNIINEWELEYIVLVKHYGADKYYDVLGIACTDDHSNVRIQYTSAWGNKTYVIRTDLTIPDPVWNVSPLIPTVPNTFESMPVNTIARTTAKAGNIFGINWLYCDESNINISDYPELKLDTTDKLPLIENSYIKSYSILNELGDKSIENAEIGDYLLINGKCLSPRTLTQEERSNVIGVYLGELEDGKKRFAFVGYLGAEACKVQIGTTGELGQYMAFLNFIYAYRVWYDDYDTGTGTPSLISNATQDKEAAMQLIDGKTYTNEILSKEWADKAYAAKYCNLVSLPDQFGKCYLPSIKEFLLLFPSDSDTKEKLTNSLSKLGYTLESTLTSSFYTSVQYDKDNAWVVQEYNDNANVYQSSISAAGYGYNVWPFIII